MMRGLTGTVLWSCTAAAIGIGLFFIKHEVKEQEARLTELNREIHRNQEAIHVLKAEWSYLNDPARLRQLSEKYLGMKPMAPAQVATLDSLPRTDAPAYAADPAPPAAARAPVALAKVQPARAETPKFAARAETPKFAARAAVLEPVKVTPVKVAAAQPAPLAAPAPSARRTIIIQSPSLAASEMSTGGETR